MGKNIAWKKIVSIVIVSVMLLSTISVMASQVITNTRSQDRVIQLTDSGAWECLENTSDTIGNTTTLFKQTFCNYSGLGLENELVEFKASFELAFDAWFAVRFRSNDPTEGPWGNATGYAILIRGDGNIELLGQRGGSMPLLAKATFPDMDVTGQTEYKITAGAVTADDGESVRLVLKMDDEVVLEYTDTDKDTMTLGGGIFSIYNYDNATTKITVFEGEGGAIGGIVDRKAPETTQKIAMDDQWFVNNVTGMALNGGVVGNMSIADEKLTFTGAAGVTNNNLITANTYSFDFSVDKRPEVEELAQGASSTVLFCKQNRDELNGHNGTGLRFTPDGRMNLVVFSGGKQKVLPAYETKLDFTETHHIIVEVVSHTDVDDWYSEVYIYIDDTNKAYMYRNNGYNPNHEPPGFFGLVNSDSNIFATVSNVKHNGEMEANDEGAVSYSVYLADAFTEGDQEFLHWKWRADSPNSSHVVITTKNGKNLGKVYYPNDTFSIKELNGQYDVLYLYTVNIEGTYSAPAIVDLTKKASDLQIDVEDIERIKVVEGKEGGKAGFVYAESGKQYIPNGVNYIGLRYGDHSTYEPAVGLTPADYDPYAVETTMKTLKENGFNFIRTFIVPGGRTAGNAGLGGDYNNTKGIYIPYMENVADFIARAQKYGIYVMPVMCENEMVNNKYFNGLSGGASGQQILFSKAGLEAKATYVKYFLQYLQEKNPDLLKSVIAISMQNEFVFHVNQAPFTQLEGTYSFNGIDYDMANDDQRRALANAALKNYYARMKEAIHEVDNQIMITEGTYAVVATGKSWDDVYGMRMPKQGSHPTVPMSVEEYLDTDLDFLDLHIYRSGIEGNAEDVWNYYQDDMKMNTEKALRLWQQKPILIGEYAGQTAYEPEYTLEGGMKFAEEIRRVALENGAVGVAMWTFDSFEQEECWNIMWEEGKYLPIISALNKDGSIRNNWDSSRYLK